MSVTARLDRLPLSNFHLKIVVVAGLAWMFGAASFTMVSFVFPVIVGAWALSPEDVGIIGTLQSVGMLVGSILVGLVADRVGRKGLLQIVFLTFAIANGASGLAVDVPSLAALRFVVGFGLGGMFPVGSTLVSELSPSKHRGMMMVGLDSFWAWGSIAVSLGAYLLIPTLGWQVSFLITGLAALYVLVLNRALVESPRHLITKGRGEEAEALVRRVEAVYYRDDLPPAAAHEPGAGTTYANVGLGSLLRPPLLKRTICVWTANFAVVYTYFGLFIWLPTLLVSAGYGLAQSFIFVLIINLGQVPGYLMTAYLVDRAGRKLMLVLGFLLYGIVAYQFGRASGEAEIILWGLLISFLNSAVFATVYAYTPELYPTWARATGTGAAVALGRIGAIIAPIVIARILGAWSMDYTLVFVVIAALLIYTSLTVLLLGEETKGRSLEKIAG
ncbi:MAG: MFS transporter [Chloroflexi bacterium]|nr:MFS transporter [Chloroflexota bacterium]